MKPNFKMLGTTTYKGKELTFSDNKGTVSPEAFGLTNFYGGRVKQLAKVPQTKTDRIYLCIENGKAIDIIQFLEEPEVQEVKQEPSYGDDVPPELKTVHPAGEKAPSLPRQSRPANRSNKQSK
jgi:hypothetical protein